MTTSISSKAQKLSLRCSNIDKQTENVILVEMLNCKKISKQKYQLFN